jgi:cobalt-precorrin-5B (C1)-methyltransferase
VEDVVGKEKGVAVKIIIPQGEIIAKKTLNEALGIVGGISVLGTSGVVEPMSSDAFKESLARFIPVAKGDGDAVIFVPGNFGYRFVVDKLGLPSKYIVKTSNFVGYMLERALSYGVKQVLLVSHIGKAVKIAGGIFNTHSKYADARQEILAAHFAHYKKDFLLFERLFHVNTMEEAVNMLKKERSFFTYLAETVAMRMERYIKKELCVDVVLFSHEYGMLGTNRSLEIITENFYE